jgi:hypothetical protein
MANQDVIVKQLIDSLTTTLTQLVIKIEAVCSSIQRMEAQQNQIRKDQPTVDDMKVLMTLKNDAIKSQADLDKAIKLLEDLIQKVVPVSKLSDLLSKPLAVVVLLVSLAGALLLLETTVTKFFDQHIRKSPTTEYTTNHSDHISPTP